MTTTPAPATSRRQRPPARFKQVDLQRAFRAAKAEGVWVTVAIGTDGSMLVTMLAEAGAAVAQSAEVNEWDVTCGHG
jgi:hypothetical protein